MLIVNNNVRVLENIRNSRCMWSYGGIQSDWRCHRSTIDLCSDYISHI